MIKELLITILPTLIIVVFLMAAALILKRATANSIIKSFILGIVAVIPALITIKLLTILFNQTISVTIPVIVFRIISALNEECFKYIFISKFSVKSRSSVHALFLACGFALSETLYLSAGDIQMAYLRSITTLPLHIVTALLLAEFYKKGNKLLFAASVVIHISFNILIQLIH